MSEKRTLEDIVAELDERDRIAAAASEANPFPPDYVLNGQGAGGEGWLTVDDALAETVDLATPRAEGGGAVLRDRFVDAADLLAEPDPGPTPYLVEDLIVERAIVACVGRWKTTKSYGLLDICISIATGEPAFDAFEIPRPGPVVLVNEESGRAAMWRRLDALCRGRAIDPERLRGRLFVATNALVKLDDPGWQEELVAIGRDLRPRLFAFDPLARMKAPSREENAQSGMAEPIEFLRRLREEADAAVSFVHHTGHTGDQMRGSSDLESVWETRLAWKRDGQSPIVTIESEHREAEAGKPVRYRIAWDHDTRSMRFPLQEEPGSPSLADRILEHLATTPGTTKEVRAAVGVRRSDVERTLEMLEKAGTPRGTLRRVPSERRDAAGRRVTVSVWEVSPQEAFDLSTQRPEPRTPRGKRRPARRRSVPTPQVFRPGRGDAASDSPSEGPQDLVKGSLDEDAELLHEAKDVILEWQRDTDRYGHSLEDAKAEALRRRGGGTGPQDEPDGDESEELF